MLATMPLHANSIRLEPAELSAWSARCRWRLVTVVVALLATTAVQSASAQRLDHQTILIERGIARVLTDMRLGVVIQDRDDNFFRVQGWPLSV